MFQSIYFIEARISAALYRKRALGLGQWSVFGLGVLVPLLSRNTIKPLVTATVQSMCVVGARAVCWSDHPAGPGGRKPTNNVFPRKHVPIPINACWEYWSCCIGKDESGRIKQSSQKQIKRALPDSSAFQDISASGCIKTSLYTPIQWETHCIDDPFTLSEACFYVSVLINIQFIVSLLERQRTIQEANRGPGWMCKGEYVPCPFVPSFLELCFSFW